MIEMAIENPSLTALTADIQSSRYRLGEKRGLWRLIDNAFPVLIVGIVGHNVQGMAKEWAFRLELSGFPSTAPEARIWDIERNATVAPNLRPTGNRRVIEAFKAWQGDTVYRPWERSSGPHFRTIGQPTGVTNLQWAPSKDLTFILEDIHELLNLDTRVDGLRQAA